MKKSYFVFAIMLMIFFMVSSANAGLFGFGGGSGGGKNHKENATVKHEPFNPAHFMIPVVDNKPIFIDNGFKMIIEPVPHRGPFIDVNGKVGCNPQPVPEPGTIILLGLGLVTLAGFAHKRFHN